MPFRMTLPAYAKINLHLYVGRIDPTEYHYLETVFQEVSLSDTLEFELTNGPCKLVVDSPLVPSGKNNLVLRALSLLKRKLGVSKGMRVHLKKRIPMGAGLGGGSSDAAAALWGGYRLWTKRTSPPLAGKRSVPPILVSCARVLGADVPFFLIGGRAWARNRGEDLFSLPPVPKRWLILLYPRVSVSTKKAYALLDSSNTRHKALECRKSQFFNSFEPVILPRFPRIAAARRCLEGEGCQSVMMSGSGSAVYGFVASVEEGRRVLKRCHGSAWESFLVHTR